MPHVGTYAGHIGQRHQRSGVACFCGLPPFWRAKTPGDRVRPMWWKGYRPRVRPTWEPKGTKRKLLEAEKTHETSSLAHSHKRARSVDTGRDTQQPGPPSKLSRSLSADNLEEAAQLDIDKLSPAADDFAAEVDYGSSPERTPSKKGTRTPSSTDSSPTRSHRPPRGSNKPDGKSVTLPRPKGVILVVKSMQVW